MGIIVSSKSPRASTFGIKGWADSGPLPKGINGFGGKVESSDSWADALPFDLVRPSSDSHCGRCDGRWVSVGADYGAQVEFDTAAEALAFIAAHSTTSRAARGTKRPRVVCDDVKTFRAAFMAAHGLTDKAVEQTAPAVVEPTAPAQTTPAAIEQPVMDLQAVIAAAVAKAVADAMAAMAVKKE
jgi:hypothetical protein